MTGIAHVAGTRTLKPHGKLTVTVSYNGVSKQFEAEATSTVQALLQHALRDFGISNQPHLFGLFTDQNVELRDQDSLADSGVQDGMKLLLRPSAVRGGS
jgi:hypothetical protein